MGIKIVKAKKSEVPKGLTPLHTYPTKHQKQLSCAAKFTPYFEESNQPEIEGELFSILLCTACPKPVVGRSIG